MAAIDFPASPTTGQLFSAANGVTYQYNGTLWLVTAGPGGGTGDFCVSGSGTLPTTATTTKPATPVSGNASGVYSSSTGNYIPPAGRYYLYGTMMATNASASGAIQMTIRKNGTTASNALDTIPAAGAFAYVAPFVTIDANGTDVFDWQIVGYTASTTSSLFTIGAFPLTGMQGPMGPPFSKPTMQLDNEVVLASPATSMTVTIPPTAKAIEIWFATLNTGNVNDASGPILNDVQSGTPNVGLNHSAQNTYSFGTTAGAVAATGTNGWALGGTTISAVGVLRVQLGFPHYVDITADYFTINAAGTITKQQAVFLTTGAAGTTGFRLQNGSSTTMVVGSYMRVFAVQ